MASRKDSKGRSLHTGESQRKNGYMYRYMDVTGKRQTIYAADLPELREKEKQTKRDIDENILTDHAIRNITVNELFQRYMQTRELAEPTRENYIRIWDRHVRDEIGNTRLTQLRPSYIRAFYVKLSRSDYSHSTIKLIHTILSPTLEMAVDDDMIRKNPAKHAFTSDLGRKAKEKEILTVEQQKNLLDFIRQSNVYNVYVPMITIMLETGLRCGELIGLTFRDVDMCKKELSVNHQLIYKNYGDGRGCAFHISTPKTDAGIRTIPLSKKAYEAFVEQKKLNFMLGRHFAGSIDGYTDFIFLTKTQKPFMPSAVNNVIYNMIDAYNKEETENAKKEHHKEAKLLPKISAHNLRHTACTNMARLGINVKVVQYLMGHAHSDVTMDVYNHLAKEADIKAEIEKMDKILGA